MSTSEYVRDERFEAITCAIRTNCQRKSRIYVGEDIKTALDSIEWKETGLLAHNTAFDGLILSHHFGHVPSYYFDTMSMARALVDHAIGASLDAVAKHLGFEGKLGGGRALTDVKGKRLEDLTRDELKALKDYNARDVDVMWDIFNKWDKFPDDELDLIHLSIKAFADPILDVDKERCQKEIDRSIKERMRLLGKVAKLLDLDSAKQRVQKTKAKREEYETFDLKTKRLYLIQNSLRNKNDFANALEEQGAEVPRKISPTTGKEIYAFAKNDLDFIKLSVHPEENVRHLFEAKLEANSSINITRATRLLQRVEGDGWRLPIMLNYCKAHTFRWSGGDKLNPQNFPARGRNGAELRRSIIAPDGYEIVVVDSSQIEARMNAWLWDHEDLLDIFRESDEGKTKDPYCHQADEIYGREITTSDKKERFVGKVAVLGLGYGMGAAKFKWTLESGSMGPSVDLSIQEAHEAVQIYRETNEPIVTGWTRLEEILSEMLNGRTTKYKGMTFTKERVYMPNGLSLHYPGLEGTPYYRKKWGNSEGERHWRNIEYWNTSGHKAKWTNLYGGKFNENLVQSLARIVVGQQMLRIAQRYRIVMMSHDEVVFLAKAKEAEAAFQFGLEQMKWNPPWCPNLPLNAEGGHDISYSK